MIEPDCLRAAAAADWLGYKPETLRKWRQERRGPAYEKRRRAVFYRVADLRATGYNDYADTVVIMPMWKELKILLAMSEGEQP